MDKKKGGCSISWGKWPTLIQALATQGFKSLNAILLPLLSLRWAVAKIVANWVPGDKEGYEVSQAWADFGLGRRSTSVTKIYGIGILLKMYTTFSQDIIHGTCISQRMQL